MRPRRSSRSTNLGLAAFEALRYARTTGRIRFPAVLAQSPEQRGISPERFAAMVCSVASGATGHDDHVIPDDMP